MDHYFKNNSWRQITVAMLGHALPTLVRSKMKTIFTAIEASTSLTFDHCFGWHPMCSGLTTSVTRCQNIFRYLAISKNENQPNLPKQPIMLPNIQINCLNICQRLVKFCQIGEILPNLVTLLKTQVFLKMGHSRPLFSSFSTNS